MDLDECESRLVDLMNAAMSYGQALQEFGSVSTIGREKADAMNRFADKVREVMVDATLPDCAQQPAPDVEGARTIEDEMQCLINCAVDFGAATKEEGAGGATRIGSSTRRIQGRPPRPHAARFK